MPAFQDKKTGKWRAIFYVTDSTGQKIRIQKRGFSTKEEALTYESDHIANKSGKDNVRDEESEKIKPRHKNVIASESAAAQTAKEKEKNDEVAEKYAIGKCIANTWIYPPNTTSRFQSAPIPNELVRRYPKTEITLEDSTTLEAIIRHQSGSKLAALSFASYIKPAEGFIEGWSPVGQEVSLCQNSILYNVLKYFDRDYYKENYLLRNNALYYDHALYTAYVKFSVGDKADGNEYYADIITCSAPNKVNQRWCNVSSERNFNALRKRAEFILLVAAAQKVDTLILGAWGCGAADQNPEEVAASFKEYLSGKFNGVFRNVVFAIPDEESTNYQTFKKILNL